MVWSSKLDRNPLKGSLGDALHAVLCGAGHNIWLLIKRLRLLLPEIMDLLAAALGGNMVSPFLVSA
jgi:IS5 family transposase